MKVEYSLLLAGCI